MANYANRQAPGWLVHGGMTVSALLVSTSFMVGKAISPLLDPVVITLIRFALAVLFFSPYIAKKYGIRFPGWQACFRYALISAHLVGFFWLMFLALRLTSPLNTGALFTTVPGISGIYSAILIRERLGIPRIVALLLAMAGALWVIFEGDMQRLLTLHYNLGDVLFFAGCLLMAAYTPLVKKLHRGEPMAIMTFWILITGVFWLCVFTVFTLPSLPATTIHGKVWLGIAYLAFFTTIVTFFISQWATLHIGPTRVMAYSYLYPPSIVVLEWIFHHKTPEWSTMLGIVVILPAMILVQKETAAREQPLNR